MIFFISGNNRNAGRLRNVVKNKFDYKCDKNGLCDIIVSDNCDPRIQTHKQTSTIREFT